MENKSRRLRLCRYYAYPEEYPSLRLRGRYMKDFGFGIGDQVSVTNPSPGKIIIQVTMTNDEINAEVNRTQTMVEHLVKDDLKTRRA